jgi:hypothetical protein
MSNPNRIEKQLSHLFGSYKAEWLKEQMFELFTEPSYFPQITAARPCVLLGGRGTGKTTVLRCLSYEGQFALKGGKSSEIPTWNYYGVYYRVNTNRVTAFKGPELSPNQWTRIFAHYFNLVCCDLLIKFLEWHYLHCPQLPRLTKDHCKRIAASLNLAEANDLAELAGKITDAQIGFEAYVNNIADNHAMRLSLQGAPIDALIEAITGLAHFKNRDFFILIDEYENFEDYQQQVVNTLIKHSGQLYSFKIGIKELGWRCRTTLNENEQLISPADYDRIRIADKLEGERFSKFALEVCNDRVSRLQLPTGKPLNITELLPGMSEEEEAEILDKQGSKIALMAAKKLAEIAPLETHQILNKMSLLEKHLITFWAEGHGGNLEECWLDYVNNPQVWKERYHNYKHALLYTLKRGKPGIQKYYTGWDTLLHLTAGNIRYFLELVDQILVRHVQDGKSLEQPVSCELQTKAAQSVGKKNLSELEGLSVQGAQLTKLLLGLGRIFQTMAADVAGHAPEVNHFHLADQLSGDPVGILEQVRKLLDSAVMHMALLRFPGNKLSDETDTRDYDYMVHPIFSAFFVFSYRRKRKMNLSGKQLLGLVTEPGKTIREVLDASDRKSEEPLPDQLLLFQAYYGKAS